MRAYLKNEAKMDHESGSRGRVLAQQANPKPSKVSHNAESYQPRNGMSLYSVTFYLTQLIFVCLGF
jgi:hypothetical protein